ncbi:MAG: hypothetical protein AB8G96_11575 [Phycisphaerales bacterium]
MSQSTHPLMHASTDHTVIATHRGAGQEKASQRSTPRTLQRVSMITLAAVAPLLLANSSANAHSGEPCGPGGMPSVLEDVFSVTERNNNVVVDFGSGIAGGPGIDVNIFEFQDLRCDWESGTDFELDWFGEPANNFEISLDDLDFVQGQFPRRVTGLTELSNEFGLPYTTSVTDRSLTIDYGFVSVVQAADGEIARFRVETDWYNCPGGGVTGDTFQTRMLVDGEVQHDVSARAGADGFDVNNGGQYPLRVEWNGCRTFTLDFFSNNGPVETMQIELNDLDFSDAGFGRTIAGLTELNSDFGWPYTVTPTATSVIIEYGPLDDFQAADGEIIQFLVEFANDFPADIDGNGAVDTSDLIAVLASWGPCTDCPANINGDANVDISDLIALLSAWGNC